MSLENQDDGLVVTYHKRKNRYKLTIVKNDREVSVVEIKASDDEEVTNAVMEQWEQSRVWYVKLESSKKIIAEHKRLPTYSENEITELTELYKLHKLKLLFEEELLVNEKLEVNFIEKLPEVVSGDTYNYGRAINDFRFYSKSQQKIFVLSNLIDKFYLKLQETDCDIDKLEDTDAVFRLILEYKIWKFFHLSQHENEFESPFAPLSRSAKPYVCSEINELFSSVIK